MRREALVALLRKRGYSYRRETENTQLYRKGTHHVYVPKNSRIPEEWCRATLRKCGLGEDDIDLALPKPN